MKKASQKKTQGKSKGLKLNKRTVKDLKPHKDVRGGRPRFGLTATCAGTPPEQCAASGG